MSEEKEELPEGWCRTTIGEIIHFINGFCFKSSDYQQEGTGVGIVRMSNLSGGLITERNMKWVDSTFLDIVSPAQQVKPGDLVIGMSGSIGQPAYNNTDKTYLLNQRVGKIVPIQVEKKLLGYFFKTVENHYLEISLGTAIKNLSTAQVKKTSINLPPLNEQKRIVAKIEALQDHSTSIKERLDRMPALLEKFRQSLLVSAFCGDLTKKWREDNPDIEPATVLLERIRKERKTKWIADEAEKIRARVETSTKKKGKAWTKERNDKALNAAMDKAHKKYKAPEPVDTTKLPELPTGWCWGNLGDIADIRSGHTFRPTDFVTSGIPVIKIANIGYGEYIVGKHQFLRKNCQHEFANVLVFPDDILIALTRPITNGRLKVCKYPATAGVGLLNQRNALLKINKDIDSDLLLYYLQSNLVREWVKANLSQTLQPNLSPLALVKCPVPIIPVSEQNKLLQLLKQSSQKIQMDVKTPLQKLSRINQSILAKAFCGELVPQNPSDEPASVLLERIKAEREAGTAKKSKTAKSSTLGHK